MSARPWLVDNIRQNHAAALGHLVADLRDRPVCVATGYANLGGLHRLATVVTDGRGVRLLLGTAPDPALGAELPISRFRATLEALRAERNVARFPHSRAAARLGAIDTWLDDDTVEVRHFGSRFLHGKAYLFGTAEDSRAALVTSANLTAAGLEHNLELGIVDYDPARATAAMTWFDELWREAVDFKDQLRDLLFPDVSLVDPQTAYLLALDELYGAEMDTEVAPTPTTTVQLVDFQRDGYERAQRIVANHGGVIYADGVGTGKTEVGLAFIEDYALRRGHHALVVAPAQLVGSWQERIHRARLPAQVVSFQQLASDEQLAPRGRQRHRHLHNARDSYRLIVVDEAHALRNPDTSWHRAMEALLGGEHKDLVMLTATPINNGLWDLYHLVMAFARHDSAFAGIGIRSVHDLFRSAGANQRDPESLDPDALFPLADAVSVRRDRRFIETQYPDAVFADGTPVRFPTPVATTVRYDLDVAHPGMFEDIAAAVGALTMARYRPSRYALDRPEAAAEASLAGLLQSAVLKRFESCWAACLRTVERMIDAHALFLASWAAGSVPSAAALRSALDDLDEVGTAAAVDDLVADVDGRPVAEFVPDYRDAVAADRDLLLRIRDRLRTIRADEDPKLARLAALLASTPERKIAVFATFGDTIRYLDEHLPRLIGGRERVAVIGTETDPDGRTAALARFCPHTVVHDGYVPLEGEVDLLLSTDVLSEGQNLQQAAVVVSYDMPWNPQRVVQRNGRVIRLRSPHTTVSLVTMLPVDGELERLLGLEAAIRRKVLAASLYGMESEILEARGSQVEGALRAFAGRLAAGDPTLFAPEDSEAGSGGFTGEALRAELRRAAAEGELERLRALPWGIGAAFRQGPGVPSRGEPGVFFACRTAGDHRYWRFISATGETVTADTEILRRIVPGPAIGCDATGVDLEGAWRQAVDSIVHEHNSRTDPREEEQRIGPAQRFALQLLRDPSITLPDGAAEAEAALSVERSSTVRRALTEIASQVGSGQKAREDAAAACVAVVEQYGLRPVQRAPLLDPITEDDIGVVCWMAVLPEGGTCAPGGGSTTP